ncbi:MAG: biotin attachment protein [Ardenticatenaceae bacterium]|nr:biotin attachment protein [Ardenticatenaceae bacterium]MCB8986885.1 biotin attachment protein [Ardenticatenaceae bacterium]
MHKLAVTIDDRVYEIEAGVFPQNEEAFALRVNGEWVTVRIPELEAAFAEMEWMVVDGRPYEVTFHNKLEWIKAYGGLHMLEVHDMAATAVQPVGNGDGRVKAPIPGLITRVMVKQGQTVRAGEPLLILEAMKMENEIRAPRAGVVSALPVAANQSVLREQVLVEIS